MCDCGQPWVRAPAIESLYDVRELPQELQNNNKKKQTLQTLELEFEVFYGDLRRRDVPFFIASHRYIDMRASYLAPYTNVWRKITVELIPLHHIQKARNTHLLALALKLY